MTRISKEKQQVIRQKTVETLHHLLTFHVSHSALRYIHEKSTENWKELEDRLHEDYPIKGIGVKATRQNLKIIDAEDGGFLHTEEDLFPGDVPSELQFYPYVAASAAYAFTILEGFGNELVDLVNPEYLNKGREAWHRGVSGHANLRNKADRLTAKGGFAKPFLRKASSVPFYVVKRLVKVKFLRNQFMHEGTADINFDNFFASIVATVVFLYFFLLPGESELSVYPYYDYHEKWK